MKKIILVGLLTASTQFTVAQETPTTRLEQIDGCVYGDIFYKVGEKHRVQQSVTDPVTQQIKMVDLEPAIVQECMEDKNADKTKSPRFYWRTLPAE